MPTTSARYVLPEFTERTTNGIRTLDPYSKLFAERIVFLGTPVDDSAANDVIAQFLHLEYAAPDQDICLYINSPGGSIAAMSAIYDTMQLVTCDVETTCLGQAASTAAVLLAAGAPGKRMALPGARIVLQQPDHRGAGPGAAVRSGDPRGRTAAAALAADDRSGAAHRREPERIAADLERDKILDATGAQAYGLVDHVVQNRKTSLNSRRIRGLRVDHPMLADPELTPPLPALTARPSAEAVVVDGYLRVVDLLGRINPSRGTDTYSALRAAQALPAAAADLLDALNRMHARGESELHAGTLARALRVLDGERRAARVGLAPEKSG